jgi:hypothetical protein
MSEVEMEWHPSLYSNNPKHYNILFCGDSWTYGGELDQFNPELYKFRRRKRFSQIVSERLNKTYYNISKPGASNDWIAYHAIDWFEQGNTCDIAVIQFSVYCRFSYYDTRNKELKRLLPGDVINKVKNEDYFAKTLINEYNGYQNYFKNLFVLNKYLKNRGVKILYLNIQKPIRHIEDNQYWASYCKDIEVDCLYDVIGHVGDGRNPNFIRPQLITNKTLPGIHPSVMGHSVIADHIINKLNSRGYLNV